MLVVETDERIVCGAAVGRDQHVTVLVLHPALSGEEQERLVRELLNEAEMIEWEAQRVP